jgi:glycosyltransferase involved in cell wall biosynthesis
VLGQPFLLHVGGADHNKNQQAVLDAYTILRERDGMTLPLVLVGGHHLDTVASTRRSAQIEAGIIRLRGLPASDLYLLYRHAAALVFPSRYEGFGLPILEAMGQGCPVITSAGGATGEVAGAAALLINPNDPTEIADAARRVLSDEATRATLIALGLAHAATFTWERTARETLATYRTTVGRV